MLAQLDSLSDSADGKGEVGHISAAQRASIMSNLAKNAGMEVPDETRMAANKVGGALPPSGELRCVVLKNMFDRLSDEAQSSPITLSLTLTLTLTLALTLPLPLPLTLAR